MKKALLIVAMLLLVSPVMATTTVKILVNPADQFTAPDGNKVQPVSIAYTSTVDVRAFALDINIRDVNGSPNFQNIRGFKVGESNGAMVGGSSGYGIFPSRFRDFIQVLNGSTIYAGDGGWNDPNYNPTTAWNEPGTTDHTWGMGFPKMIVEMGALYVGDPNKPAQSGTLFTFDVNSYGLTGTFHMTVAADALRGGVVNSDGNTIVATYEANDVCFAAPPVCTVPNVVSEPEAQATADIIAAGFTLGTRTTTCSDTPGIVLGDVISTNPIAGAQPGCGTAVAYVVSTGPCCVTPLNEIGALQAAAVSAWNGQGFANTSGVGVVDCNGLLGKVISYNPTGCVPTSTTINYTYGINPTVPSIIGLTKAQAEAAITNAHLTVGTETGVFSDAVPVNQVTAQSPANGTSVACGSAVTLSYVCRTVHCLNPYCKGDLNKDKWVRANDVTALGTLITSYGPPNYRAQNTTCAYEPCGDINGDNWVRANDITALGTQITGYGAPNYRCSCGTTNCPYYTP